ncbi:MAG: hypothetical protein U1D70_18190 [Methylobacter sp.]|nr:hypothetical protein [Methylobacter sp.]MDP3055611.1 hypothetical protein [Methylobacter sp.]MDP3361017.1 hypothetical protein [Methylobacter sp.]MDZ4220940.1 hypothetical protein [Methylobacter sp.]
MTISLVFLTGFNSDPLAEKQAAAVAAKEEQGNSKAPPVNSKQKKTKTENTVSSVKSSDIDDTKFQKTLDLSVPFKLPEKTWQKPEQNKPVQRESSNIFATKKEKSQALSLDGQMLMSQELEADKQKSVDGAGIVINLKR